MIYLFPTDLPQSIIIESLIQNPQLKIPELLKHTQNFYSTSRPTFYRLIHSMVEKQILTKNKTYLSLNEQWKDNLIFTANVLKQQQTNSQIQLPKENEKNSFHAESLIMLDTIWNDLQMRCLKSSQTPNLYKISDHFVWLLGIAKNETAQIASFHKYQIHYHIGILGNTFLDTYVCETYSHENTNIKHIQTDFFPQEKYHNNIIADYIIEFLMPDKLHNYFTAFLQSTTNIKDFKPERFTEIFEMKCPCTLTIRKSKQEAKAFIEALNEQL